MKKLFLLLIVLLSFIKVDAQKLIPNSIFIGTVELKAKSSAPAVGPVGSLYADTNGVLYISDGVAWQEVGLTDLSNYMDLTTTQNVGGQKTFTDHFRTSKHTINTFSNTPNFEFLSNNDTNHGFATSYNSLRTGTATPYESALFNIKVINRNIGAENTSAELSLLNNGVITNFGFESNGDFFVDGAFRTISASPLYSSPGGVDATAGDLLTANGTGGSAWIPFDLSEYARLDGATFTGPITGINGGFSGIVRAGGLRIDGDVVVGNGVGLEMYYNSSSETSIIQSFTRGINVLEPLIIGGSSITLTGGLTTLNDGLSVIGSGTFSVDVNCVDLNYSGALNDVSDKRVKDSIRDFDFNREAFERLAIKRYNYKADSTNIDYINPMAQALEVDFPWLVNHSDSRIVRNDSIIKISTLSDLEKSNIQDEDRLHTIKTMQLSVMAIEGLRLEMIKNDELKLDIEVLKSLVQNLTTRLDAIDAL